MGTLRTKPLIFLDLETTGFFPGRHEIIEIGALKVEPQKPFKVLAEFELKVSPKALEKADSAALKVVGFTSEEWMAAVELDGALKLLGEFTEGGILAGYNVSFDWSFLTFAYSLLGQDDPFHYHRLDVMSMAYAKLYKKRAVTKFSLKEICSYLKIPQKHAHRALADAQTTYLVFKKLIDLD